jgi:hypothetical protein
MGDLQTSTVTRQLLDSGLRSDLVHRGARVLRSITVKLHKLGQIELGLLEHLDLTDKAVLQREDAHALLLNLGTNGLGERDTKEE